MISRVTIPLLVVSLVGAQGCGGFFGQRPTHLVFAQRTTVGVDVSPALETGDVQLVVGYKRRTATFIPVADVPAADGDEAAYERESMSVLSMGKLTVSFWRLPEVIECFATGEAAVSIAESPTRTGAFVCDAASFVPPEGPGTASGDDSDPEPTPQ